MFRIVQLLLLVSAVALVCEAKKRAHKVRLGSNPSVVIRLNDLAIASFLKSVANLSSVYAKKAPIPDVNTTVSGVDITITSAHITHFPEPEFKHKLTAPNNISGLVRIKALGLETPFKTARHLLRTTQDDSGRLVFNVTNATVKYALILGKTEVGYPDIQSFECSADLGPSQMVVQKNHEQFSKDVFEMAAKTIRPLYKTQVCNVIREMLKSQLHQFMAGLPDEIVVNQYVSLKCRPNVIVKAPPQKKPYIDINLFVKLLTDSDQVSPSVPQPFEEGPYNKNAMVVMFISDSVINDALFQMHVNNMFGLVVDKKKEPTLHQWITLHCSTGHEDCLGKAVPVLEKKYGAQADTILKINTTKVPKAEFTKGKGLFTVGAVSELIIIGADGKQNPEMKADIQVVGDITVAVNNGELFGKVIIESVSVSTVKPENKKWEPNLGRTIKQIIEAQINRDFLGQGFPLKMPFGFGLEQPKISILTHTLQIETGFVFTPRVDENKKKRKV